jgi:hypothetical protein
MNLKPIDRNALERAIERCRPEDAVRRQQIDSRLAAGEDWTEIAKSCAHHCQLEALHCAWQDPPMYADPGALREPYGDPRAAREAAELLQQLSRRSVAIRAESVAGA